MAYYPRLHVIFAVLLLTHCCVGLKPREEEEHGHEEEGHSHEGEPDVHILLEEFGDGEHMDFEGFEKLFDLTFSGEGGDEGHAGHNHRVISSRAGEEICHGEQELFDDNDKDGDLELNETEVESVAAAMLQMVADGCHKRVAQEDIIECQNKPSTSAQAWGYGILSVIIVSLTSWLCLFFLPFKFQYVYPLIAEIGIAFSVGSGVGLALLILYPYVARLSPTMEELTLINGVDPGHLDLFYVMLVSAITVVTLFVIERFLHDWHTSSGAQGMRKPISVQVFADLDKWSDAIDEEVGAVPVDNMFSHPVELFTDADDFKPLSSHLENALVDQKDNSLEDPMTDLQTDATKEPKSIKTAAYLLLITESFHNFADGLVLGGAWSVTPAIGLAASIAIFAHEIPMEVSNFAILVKSGYSRLRALLTNAALGLFALLGVVIGLAVGSSIAEGNRYIMAIALGGFLYVPLVSLIPELVKLQGFKHTMIHVVCMLVGFGLMVMLAILEPFAVC